MTFLRHFSLSALLLVSTGCGAAVSHSPVAGPTGTLSGQHHLDKEIQRRVEKGELILRFGSFFEGTLRASTLFGHEGVFVLTALPGSPTPGTVQVRFPAADEAKIVPGKRHRVFVNYTYVEVETGKVAFTGHPYQASLSE